MKTYRMWVPNRKGRADLHFNAPDIKKISVVHVTVSEATEFGSSSLLGGQSFLAHFGAASITVQNVSVRDGGVDFNVFVDWSSPLNLVTDITVLDPPVEVIQGS
jgi:hypothetical protein